MEDIGIRNGDKYLGTRLLPNRKNASLVYEVGNQTIILGTVKDTDLFQIALETILERKAEEV